jgi:putative ABC transport system substrate-binding protein
MRRRDFIGLLGGAAAWPIAAWGQQPQVPVVGFLHQSAPNEKTDKAFRQGLGETGYAEGKNVAIEYRWAEGHIDRLPAMAADLVRRGVAVIVTPGSMANAGLAAKAVTSTVPIIFGGGADPIQLGLVNSLNQPGGNATGFVELNTEIASKRLGLLHDLIPKGSRFVLLVEPTGTGLTIVPTLQAAASSIGVQVEPLVTPVTHPQIDAAFATLAQRQIDGLMVSPNPEFYDHVTEIAALATQHALPAIYWDRDLVESGGLMSYGSSVTEMFRQVGIYAGRVLKGEKPATMPVMQASKFELIINLKAAKAIGLAVSPLLLAQADEVIE